MSNEGTILHADADSCYASVEQRDERELKGVPDRWHLFRMVDV